MVCMTWKVELEYDREEESYEAETLEELVKQMHSDGRIHWERIRYVELSRIATEEEAEEFAKLFKQAASEGATLYEETLLYRDEKRLSLYLQSALSTFTGEIDYCNSAGVQRAKSRAEDVLKGCFWDLHSKSKEELKEKYLKLLKDKLHELAP